MFQGICLVAQSGYDQRRPIDQFRSFARQGGKERVTQPTQYCKAYELISTIAHGDHMTYLPLARKYRPARFSDLVGQEATALSLANAIALKRSPPVVLFTGVRGVGKTTLARLYAKALNCEQGPTADPCNQCQSCLAINTGSHEDVLEIDGASNTSVDDVRALRETLGYIPQRGSYKVYIIDEVHMLSQSAFNALLKTTEEPPAHVIFIFATTELDKVPETIRSRCQIFFLKKFPSAVIVSRLQSILTAEGIAFDPHALPLIARHGRGSMRDALSFLDRCIAQGGGEVRITSVTELANDASSQVFMDLLRGLTLRKPAIIDTAIRLLAASGADFFEAANAVATAARHTFIIKDLGRGAGDLVLLGLAEDEIEALAGIAAISQPMDLNRIFRTMVKAAGDMQDSEMDRYIFENYCLEWCLDPGITLQPSAKHAPNEMTRPPTVRGIAVSHPPAATSIPAPSMPTPSLPQVQASVAVFPESWAALVQKWKQLKPMQGRLVEEAVCTSYSPQAISLAINSTSMSAKTLMAKDEQQKVVAQLADLFSFKGTFKIETREGATAKQESPLEVRQREDKARQDDIRDKALHNPMTRDIVSLFNGKIESIEVK